MIKLIIASFFVASALADIQAITLTKVSKNPPELVPSPSSHYPSSTPNYPSSPHHPSPTPHHHSEKVIEILRNEQDMNPDGSYQWAYETENGINAEEHSEMRQVDKELAKSAQGSWSFTSPEGEKIEMSYVADENGYQPVGSHIPTPPPIPAAIQRALEWIAAHPEPEEKLIKKSHNIDIV